VIPPAPNACLDATSAIPSSTDVLATRRRRVRLHRAYTVAAFITSIVSSPPT
jgi:hypothetical protein